LTFTAAEDTGERGDVLLDVRSLSKTFPGQIALDRASFRVRSGEVHALLGLNGSGKSTLIKVLSGYHREDPGSEVTVFGTEVAAHTARSTFPGRMAMLHQDLGLIVRMSVAENMGLGSHFAHDRFGRIRWKQQRDVTIQACRRVGSDVDPRDLIKDLDASSRVLVGLARAIQSLDQVDGSLVFADEPTAALGRVDVERVFRGLRELAKAGAGVVVVTHRLEEVLAFCDSLTVLRDGRSIAEGVTSGLDRSRLAALLTGRNQPNSYPAGVPAPDPTRTVKTAQEPDSVSVRQLGPRVVAGPDRSVPPLLEVQDLRGHVLADLSFTVAPGEVLGVAGLVGSGREELGPLLVGASPRSGGQVSLSGRAVAPNPQGAARARIGYVPADRKGQALLMKASMAQNMTMNAEISRFRGAWLDTRKSDGIVRDWIGRMHLDPPDPNRRISLLSGGNQQKVVLARWLRMSPVLMVLDDPMQGVDVNAKEAIFRIIRRTAEQGSGVLLISSDSIELAEVADRVLVLREGRIGAQLTGANMTSESIIMEVEG
jgi:ribose transport system ATP-binding protein